MDIYVVVKPENIINPSVYAFSDEDERDKYLREHGDDTSYPEDVVLDIEVENTIPASCPLGLGGYDRIDIERLVELTVERLRASAEHNHEQAAYLRGRADEYAAQNAIAERDLPAIYELAAARLYGHGPKEGLQS